MDYIAYKLTSRDFVILDKQFSSILQGKKIRLQKTATGKKFAYVVHNNKKIALHRFILNASDNELVEFKSDNTLDCTVSNLSISNLDNPNRTTKNPTSYKWVYKTNKGFKAVIYRNNRVEYLGSFKCPHLAAKSYNEAALKDGLSLKYLNISNELKILCGSKQYWINLEKFIGKPIDVNIIKTFTGE